MSRGIFPVRDYLHRWKLFRSLWLQVEKFLIGIRTTTIFKRA